MKVSMPIQSEVWHGLRPCSPDGLPYVGRSKKFSNLIFATGHAMMGVSLAPATGKIINQLVNEEKVNLNYIGAFDPGRYQ